MLKIRFDIKLTEGQRAAHRLVEDSNNNVVVMVYSRQSGKSVLAEILCIEYLFKANTFNAYITPTFALGRKVYTEIIRLLQTTGIVKKANSSTLTIETVYGSILQFFSAEAYTSIRGNTVSGILIIDEAAYIADILPNGENFWGNVVLPITKARKPKTVLISTPCGKQGFFYDYYLRALRGDKGIVSLTRTIYDDELVKHEDIEEIKRSIPPKAFEQEFECKWLDSSLTFFTDFENCFEDFRYIAQKEWVGIDVSAGGEDATVVARINEKNEVKVEKIDGTLDQKYEKIANIINRNNPNAVYMEVNGLGAPVYNEVRKLLRNRNRMHEWLTTNESKEEIIADLAVEIANKNIHFDSTDTELYGEFGTFICKISKTKKLTFGAQSGKHDDMVMAVAMALKCKKDFKYAGKNNNVFINTNKGFIR